MSCQIQNNKNKKSLNKKQLVKKNQRDEIKFQLEVSEEAYVDFEKNIFFYSRKLSVCEFAYKINKNPSEIVKYFFMRGIILNQNTILTEEQLGELCLEFGLDFRKQKIITHENLLENFEINDDPETLVRRPPIVTIMGHVDHGKTTLLDTIRNSNIVSKEHGGITQHIGAYQIITRSNHKITFVDTPGHEAFTQMRIRGSLITDIIILVVAADDGVMPQTKEAINHAKAAGVPIIVFVNKMDKPGANIDNVMMQLSKAELVAEEWGGATPYIKGSAKIKQGIDELLETILLVAELYDFRVNQTRFAIGTILESYLDKSLGPVLTLLVQSGTLKIKDALVAGNAFGYVRDMWDENGKKLKQALPSTPVVIHGLNELPDAGDKFMVFQDERLAREVAIKRKAAEVVNKRYNKVGSFSLSSLSKQIRDNKLKQINIILKADTKGTVEALKNSLEKIKVEDIKINIIHAAVGTITDSDISLGLISQAFIIGFNIRPNIYIINKASNEGVEIRLHNIIYKVVEEIESAIIRMTNSSVAKEEVFGQLEVRKLFFHSNIGMIAGSHVVGGSIFNNSKIRVLRNGMVIYRGEIASLKYGKEDIKEAKEGSDCGLIIKGFNDIKENDIIEAYLERKKF